MRPAFADAIASPDAARRMMVAEDKRKELSDKLEASRSWSGWTSDFVGIGFEGESVAFEGFKKLVSDAQDAANEIVVLRGTLEIGSDSRPIVGIICLNKDTKAHVPWQLDSVNSMSGTVGDNLLRWADKSHCEFGLESSPIAIHEYRLVGLPS